MAKTKKKEKQTTKLKVGRKLPKDGNVVNPTFKMKKIKIGDKKFNPFDDTPKPKFQINEVLKSLDTNSPTEKIKLLKIIQNLIVSDENILNPDIIKSFQKISELMAVSNFDVRKQVLVTMKVILQKFSETKQKPNFFLIEKWINCAMTNPQDDVRYDSIKFLQLILHKLPNTLSHFHSLFEKLLNLISYKPTNNTVRKLLISPSEKTGTIEWRKTVLKCLVTFLEQNAISETPTPMETRAIITVANADVYNLTKHVNVKSVNSYENIMLGNSNIVNFCSDFESFEAFIIELMPVLFESFIECIPSVYNSISFCNSDIMFAILQIVQHLAKWLIAMPGHEELKTLLHSKYNDELFNKFFSNFPYSENNVHPSYVFKVNLVLCNIFSLVILRGSYPPILDEKICRYIHAQLTVEKNQIDVLSEILPILEITLQNEKKVEIFTPLLSQLLTLYFELTSFDQRRKEITSFFTKLSININLYHHLHLNSVLNDWWKHMPIELLAIVTGNHDFDENHQKLFETVLRVCNQDYSFLCTLREPENLKLIMDLAVSENPAVRTIALKFLTKLNPITDDYFKRIIQILRSNNITTCDIERFLLDLAMRCSLDKNRLGFNMKDYICFLMNLVVGPAFHEDEFGDNIMDESKFEYLNHCIPFKLTQYNVVPDHRSHTENDTTNFVISLLSDLPNPNYVIAVVQSYLNLFLQQCDKISAHFAIIVLKFAYRFSSTYVQNVSDEFMFNVGDLLVGLYLYCLAMQSACHDDPNLKVDWESVFVNLKKYTFNVGYALKVVMNQMEEINSVSYLFCIGQLLNQMFTTLALRNVDFMELHTFLRLLKNKFGKDVIQQKWWPRIHKWSQLAVFEE